MIDMVVDVGDMGKRDGVFWFGNGLSEGGDFR